MSDADLPGPAGDALRVGDAERNSALEALGEHLGAGRLDLDEYGTRSSAASVARTVGDLRALFVDLPPPYPKLPGTALPARRPASTPSRAAGNFPARPSSDARTRNQRIASVALAASGIISLLLFFVVKNWVVFLLPALIAVIASAAWGSDWKNPRQDG